MNTQSSYRRHGYAEAFCALLIQKIRVINAVLHSNDSAPFLPYGV